MPEPGAQRASDRWLSIALSVLLHAALLGLLVYGWMLYRQPPPPAPTLAVEARVVDARAMQGAPTPAPPQPAPPPPAPPPPVEESSGPPEPTAEELAQREAQRKQADEAAAAAQRAAEQKAQEEEAAKKVEAERKAREAAEAQKRQEEQQRQADAQAKAEREADLKRSLAAEEQTSSNAARAGPALANWQAQIAAKITRAWLRPPTAKPGIECMLNVTQVPGGEVTQVTIGQCNGDQAVRESIEAAVYRASPLPPPPDPSLFDRNLKINFKPD
jgi:colicin import membrane protein